MAVVKPAAKPVGLAGGGWAGWNAPHIQNTEKIGGKTLIPGMSYGPTNVKGDPGSRAIPPMIAPAPPPLPADPRTQLANLINPGTRNGIYYPGGGTSAWSEGGRVGGGWGGSANGGASVGSYGNPGAQGPNSSYGGGWGTGWGGLGLGGSNTGTFGGLGRAIGGLWGGGHDSGKSSKGGNVGMGGKGSFF